MYEINTNVYEINTNMCGINTNVHKINTNVYRLYPGQMSNREEAHFAMAAVTSIGAIWTGALPLLGAQVLQQHIILKNTYNFNVY